MITTKRIVTDSQIITTTIEERSRYVDYNDILESVKVEVDEYSNEPPWENCDGYEHELSYNDHEGLPDSRGYVSRDRCVVIVDDDTITKVWGYNGYDGCSKQVRAELIAQEKRRTIDTIVNWYTNGWAYYSVFGDYEGYLDSLHGIDCIDYAENDVRYYIADEIASQMENDGFIVENKPTHATYTKLDHFRDKLEHNRCLGVVKI